jgi:hypothetical protein
MVSRIDALAWFAVRPSNLSTISCFGVHTLEKSSSRLFGVMGGSITRRRRRTLSLHGG